MAKPRKRVRKKAAKPNNSGNSVARSWKMMYQCNPKGHPVYRPNRADTIFGQRALSMALTNAKSKKVVDIGGGKGHFTSKLKRPNVEATIVDFSGASLFSHSIKVKNVKGNAEKLPKEWTGKFGVASLYYSLSYTNKKKTISEVRRVLEKGGRVIALLHHSNSIYVNSIKKSGMGKAKLMELLVKVKKKKIKNMQQFNEAALKALKEVEMVPENVEELFKAAQIYFENRKGARHLSKNRQRLYEQDFDKYIRQSNEMTNAFNPLLRPGAIFSSQGEVRKFFEENGFKIRVLKTLKTKKRQGGTEPICYAVYVEKI